MGLPPILPTTPSDNERTCMDRSAKLGEKGAPGCMVRKPWAVHGLLSVVALAGVETIRGFRLGVELLLRGSSSWSVSTGVGSVGAMMED